MALNANVEILNETPHDSPGNSVLTYQWCCYHYTDGSQQHGYRFIWRRPDGSLQAARGQARLPSKREMQQLMKLADDEGWGDHDADTFDLDQAA